MYYYILDPHNLSLETFERLQVELQGLLSEFNITGEMQRVTTLKTIGDLVENAASRGVKTLIACGNDDTFNMMIARLAGKEFTLGFIPFSPATSYLAKILGVTDLNLAVKTIAARRVEQMDMAKINNLHFISYLEFGVLSQRLQNAGLWQNLKFLSGNPVNLTVRIDDSYNIDMHCLGGLVVNSRSTSSKTATIANPTDKFLDLLILEKLSKLDILKYKSIIADNRLEELPHPTVIKCRKVEFLQPRGFPLTIFGRVITKFPATVEMLDQKLRIIVGKNRTFWHVAQNT